MKKLFPLLLLALSPQAFSCINVEQNLVCIGDKVYKGSSYSQGATVVAEDRFSQRVTVRSNATGNSAIEDVRNLDITRGCLGSHCVSDKVYKATSYSQGARILGINFARGTITVQSVATSNLAVETPDLLATTQGCLESACIGDKVYKGTSYSQGARILGINSRNRTLVVQSVATSNLGLEELENVDLANNSCVGNVCVGDRVFKGTSYAQGARVLAVNQYQYLATVQSIASSNLVRENIHDLQSTNHDDPQQPRPRPPRPPSRPPQEPTPRPPQRETVTVQCMASRLDPSGALVANYNGSATGFPGSALKQEACSRALRSCESDLRGRQTCIINR